MSSFQLPSARQNGMALALLLWMLTAMALTVSAVVHFSQGDTSMSQLRLKQAQDHWLGRGLARVAIAEMMIAGVGNTAQDDDFEPLLEEQTQESNVLFQSDYALQDGGAKVSIFAAAGFPSLNTANEGELLALFQGVGGLAVDSASQAAAAVIEYRGRSSPVSFDSVRSVGFRYVEELLMMPGMTRIAYDRIKPWVHTLDTGGVSGGSAPSQLSSLFPDPESLNGSEDTNVPTFANAEQRRNLGRNAPVVVIIDFDHGEGRRYRQVVHADISKAQLIRVGPVERATGEMVAL